MKTELAIVACRRKIGFFDWQDALWPPRAHSANSVGQSFWGLKISGDTITSHCPALKTITISYVWAWMVPLMVLSSRNWFTNMKLGLLANLRWTSQQIQNCALKRMRFNNLILGRNHLKFPAASCWLTKLLKNYLVESNHVFRKRNSVAGRNCVYKKWRRNWGAQIKRVVPGAQNCVFLCTRRIHANMLWAPSTWIYWT